MWFGFACNALGRVDIRRVVRDLYAEICSTGLSGYHTQKRIRGKAYLCLYLMRIKGLPALFAKKVGESRPRLPEGESGRHLLPLNYYKHMYFLFRQHSYLIFLESVEFAPHSAPPVTGRDFVRIASASARSRTIMSKGSSDDHDRD